MRRYERKVSRMSTNNLEQAAVAVVAAGVTAGAAGAAESKAVDELIARIRDESDEVRTDAWLSAGDVGAPAVKPLATVMADDAPEIARAAKRGLWKVVRHGGRPGADAERKAVTAELIPLLADGQSGPVRREVVWMLSEIGGDESIGPIASILSNNALREDARMALERIPGAASIEALEAALDAASDDFKPNIAQSLRQRGVAVPGLSCAKLAPTKQTDVKPRTSARSTRETKRERK